MAKTLLKSADDQLPDLQDDLLDIEEDAEDLAAWVERLRDNVCADYGLPSYQWRELPTELRHPLEIIIERTDEIRRCADYAWRLLNSR
ncbi:hypothetical protein GOL24_10815 [Sinorhizobium medicae]|nr:hypothetical protein [Sinorhizobium medicae]